MHMSYSELNPSVVEKRRRIKEVETFLSAERGHMPMLSIQVLQLHTFPSFLDMQRCEYSHLLFVFQYVKKYGNVFSMKFGNLPTVVVTGLPLIKEALVHQGHKFVERPVSPIRERMVKKNGKVLTNVRCVCLIILRSINGASVTRPLQHTLETTPIIKLLHLVEA